MVKSDILVIVPSHIKSLEQLDYLRRCLNSLINQTYEADILVSISFNKPYSLDFSEFPQVSFIVSEEQKYQMEHLYILDHLVLMYTYSSTEYFVLNLSKAVSPTTVPK